MALESGGDAALLWAALRAGAALLVLSLLAWAWMHWRGRAHERRSALRVVDRTWLARGASAVLLEGAGRRFLVGVGADGVRLLAELDRAGEPEDFARAMERAVQGPRGASR